MSDVRQLDPQGIGERLLCYRQLNPDKLLSEVADMIPWDDPDLPVMSDEPSGLRAARQRKQELKERAVAGDRFAAALLTGKTLAEDPVD